MGRYSKCVSPALALRNLLSTLEVEDWYGKRRAEGLKPASDRPKMGRDLMTTTPAAGATRTLPPHRLHPRCRYVTGASSASVALNTWGSGGTHCETDVVTRPPPTSQPARSQRKSPSHSGDQSVMRKNHALLARVSRAGMGKDGCHDRVVTRRSTALARPQGGWRPVTSPGRPGSDSDAFSLSPASPTCRCVPRRGFHPRSTCNGVNRFRLTLSWNRRPVRALSTMTTLQRVPHHAGHCHGVGALQSGTPEINLALAALELWLQAWALGTDKELGPSHAGARRDRSGSARKDTVVDADVTPAGRSHLPWPEGTWQEQI